MEKNTVLAIVLSAGFLVLWFWLNQPKHQQQPISSAPQQVSPQTANEAAAKKEPVSESITKNIEKKDTQIAKILVETPNAIVRLSSRGAGIESWKIKDIAGWVDLVLEPDNTRRPLETFPDIPFEPSTLSVHIAEGEAPQKLNFYFASPDGLTISKTYIFDPASSIVGLYLEFTNTAAQPRGIPDWSIGWGPGLNTTEREIKENTREMRAIGFKKPDIIRFKQQAYQGAFSWAAVDNRYFLAALIPASTSYFSGISAEVGEQTPPIFRGEVPGATLAPRQTVGYRFSIYAGPKGYLHLKKLGYDLEESVNFGMFGFLGKAALQALFFFHKITGNYGWAIILLTVCLQIVLFPLTMKSYRASLAMKKLQPQIQALQAKYKQDPKRLNVEMMNLYKSSGTNPFGGCLPMLLQIPIFWALFTTLRNSFELRGAPFFGWIHDLSLRDPLYILPILMGAAMLAQQKMSSVSADPTQAKMMLLMPIIFTVFFLNFPAGLVLYWLTNSLLTMAGQLIIMKKDSVVSPT